MPTQRYRRSYGNGSIYERRNADGTISFVGQWRDGGVRRKQTLGRRTREFTKTKAQKRLRELMEATAGPVAERLTLRQVWDAHERTLRDDKGRKPSSIRGYRSIAEAHIFPALGDRPVDRITQEDIDKFRGRLSAKKGRRGNPLSPQTRRNVLGLLAAMLTTARKRKWLTHALEVEKPEKRRPGGIEAFDPTEVRALVRAAEDEQDAALFLTAALTGLRMGELLALRWRDVHFLGSAIRVERSFSGTERVDGITVPIVTTPKSGKVRSVPMAPEVAEALARLGQREHFIDPDDLVFVGTVGGFLDKSALRRRYYVALRRAGLRRLTFHDLRHVFGTTMINRASITQVQAWMGHADIQTTALYLHFKSRESDAALVAEAFAPPTIPSGAAV